MAKLASKVYGDALFELAVEESKVDVLMEEASEILQIMDVEPELNKFMDHPKIVKDEKIQFLEKIFKDRVSKDMTGFLILMVKKDRYHEAKAALIYFLERVKEYKKIGVAYVTTAIELSASQKATVEQKLLSTTSYENFEMHYTVDQSLIGGMVIRIGDRVVDSSLRSRIQDLSRNLKKLQVN